MPHLNGIGLENFKVFKDKQWFDFAPITILTGTNSSGKSTVINALRLLNDSYKHIKFEKSYSNTKQSLGLDNILRSGFDVSEILKRYGNLNQFVNNTSKEKEFSFSFKHESFEVQDTLEIMFTISVQDNKLRNGFIKEVSIISVEQNKKIFSIGRRKKDNQSFHVTKIDLIYFYEALEMWIKYLISIDILKSKIELYDKNDDSLLLKEINEDIKEHNKLFNDSQILVYENYHNALEPGTRYIQPNPISDDTKYDTINKLEKSKSIYEEYKQGLFYDFSVLKQISDETYLEFLSLIEGYYGEISEGTYQQLTKDILNVLSSVEWGIPNKYITESDSEGADYLFPSLNEHSESVRNNFRRNHSGLNLDFFIFDIIYGSSTGLATNYSDIKLSNTEDIKLLINKVLKGNSTFIKEVFEPLILLFPKPYIIVNEEERHLYKDARLRQSESEKYFHNKFIQKILSLIIISYNSFGKIEFVEAQRINVKRNFQLSDIDNFSSQIKQLFKFSEERYNYCIDFLNKWVSFFGIAEKIEIENYSDTDIFKIYLYKKQNKELLADYGYGISQLLPVILSLLPSPNTDGVNFDPFNQPSYFGRIVVIEEPENSLHPAFQSKLADMFVEAVTKFNIQLIIETHSEYLIRRLQVLTANTYQENKNDTLPKLNVEDTNIYYMYNPEQIPEGEKQVIKINIEKDGALSKNFGRGFFDEASNLNIALYSFTNINKN